MTENGDALPRGNYYTDGSYMTTDLRKGVTRNRAGTRMVALTNDFLLGFRGALADECGPAADTVLKTCGRTWGKRFAARFEREMTDFYGIAAGDFSMAMFHACLAEAFARHGWGRLELDLRLHDRGLILARIEHPVMGEIVTDADAPVETLMVGILAGFFSHFSGENLDCVQTCCKARGAADTRFIIGLGKRLGPVPGWLGQGRTHDEIIAEVVNTRA